jgi:CRISPR-associated endoribonuclease Cas6
LIDTYSTIHMKGAVFEMQLKAICCVLKKPADIRGHETRIRIELVSTSSQILLPESYNYFLQSYIYKSISAALAKKLHDEGWEYGKRRFKMFTFSQLYATQSERIASAVPSASQHSRRYIRLSSPCWFFLSSPEQQILQELAQSLLEDKEARLGNNILQLSSVTVLTSPEFSSDEVSTVSIRTMSPITVYKTDETHHTTYFSPHDAAFAPYVRENARRKFTAYAGHEPDLAGFDITPIEERDHPVTIDFKGTMIRGYAGRFHLTGSADILRFLYDAGVGSKNSEGCGMIELQQ